MAVELEYKQDDNLLAKLSFRHPLRRYQKEIIELVNNKLECGEKRIHIVAPPGAGKTILGLQIISQFKGNSLILSPNTTIQSQWGQKVDLFLPPYISAEDIIGTHEDKPLKPITLLTYQVLSTPGREQEYLETLAHQSWVDELCRSISVGAGQAELRILELLQNNPKEHQKELSRHTSKLRRKLTEVMELKDVLHPNALQLLQALRRQKFELVIFDECHHLTDYWAAVMIHLVKYLGDPIVIGLTGTPPEDSSVGQETRYLSLVGNIDYQVPTPALIREGGLAPFQDLVYFTRPTLNEMEFLEKQHEEFHQLLDDLNYIKGFHNFKRKDLAKEIEGSRRALSGGQYSQSEPEKPKSLLEAWVESRVASIVENDWSQFAELKLELFTSLIRYLFQFKLPIPRQIDRLDTFKQPLLLEDWMLLIEDLSLHHLKTSANVNDHKLYQRIKAAVRKLGYGLTEQGIRKQATPVDRVLAYSLSKAQAVAEILDLEHKNLQDKLRAAVVTDFEKMSAIASDSVHTNETGGAIAVFKELLKADISQYLNPCLVTGSLLLVDKRVADQFLDKAKAYITKEGFNFEFIVQDNDNSSYVEISAQSSSWETRLYVGMATSIFEAGIVKCLIGTRGIFGEGWDSQSLNTLIDLTTTTSPVSVKQLRGRTIRINASNPLGQQKVANNWDVVCVAPELEKGLNDYHRFTRKQDGFWGLADDGHIECGAGHVHPLFSKQIPFSVLTAPGPFNQEMMRRALKRKKVYEQWQVGKSYSNYELGCVEISKLRKMAITPPFLRYNFKYSEHVRHLRAEFAGVWWEYAGLGALSSSMCSIASSALSYVNTPAPLIPFTASLWLASRKHRYLFNRLKEKFCQPNNQSSLKDIACAIVSALKEHKLLPQNIQAENIHVTLRSDGSHRVCLVNIDSELSQLFANTFYEVMAPIGNQNYLIPKYEYALPEVKKGKDKNHAFFKAYIKGKADLQIATHHAVPKAFAGSVKGRKIFQAAWNKYVSPGSIVATDKKPELKEKYAGTGPNLSIRFLWI